MISVSISKSYPFHPQDGERVALVVGAVAAERAEAGPFVEFHGRGVLFVDIYILHVQFGKCLLNQHFSYAFPEMVRMEEQHFYLAGLYPGESYADTIAVNHP